MIQNNFKILKFATRNISFLCFYYDVMVNIKWNSREFNKIQIKTKTENIDVSIRKYPSHPAGGATLWTGLSDFM